MIYTFKNKTTGEVKEVSIPMKDYEPYKGETGEEEEWDRVYDVPRINANGSLNSVDPWDQKGFVGRTGRMKGTVGDLQDQAQELSIARAEKNGGVDPVKRKYLDNYSKTRGGAKHVADLKTSFEKNGVKVEL